MDRLLEYFINEPEREFHVRELAKLTKKSPSTISKYLTEFEKKELLTSEKKLNHLFFKANTKSTAFKDKKLFYNIQKIRNSGLIEQLNDKYNPEAIILFGSFAKADNIITSDVDILVVTPSKKEINLEKFERKLKHQVQLFLHSKKELETMKASNKNLLNNFVNGIVLEGFWEIFK